MAAKKKTAVATTAPTTPGPENPPVADVSEQEMLDSEDLRKLNARLRRDQGISLAEALNRIFWRHGFGADMRD